jgi:ribosome-associated protein
MMTTEQRLALVVKAMEDRKASDIRVLDVRGISSITDLMVIASGNSDRQVAAIARNVVEEAKHHGEQPLGVEGENSGQWVLVDLGDVVVHVMQPQIRDFYQLEKLWGDLGGHTALAA